ncbi:MAG: hypothetical protein LUH51_04750 [Firmicutes bacterium]|nr:hypothetical protein [Bacillota bacterium]
MKKMFTILTALLLLSLAACGEQSDPADEQVITRASSAQEESAEASEPTLSEQAEENNVSLAAAAFSFEAEGVTLTPGEAFDSSALPEPVSTYTVPSCAVDGSDNVYTYETFELTAFDDGSGETIYSIYLLDPNVTTPEGLALGDTLARVTELYGEDYALDGTALTYTLGDTQLVIILQDESVISIEYLLVL